MPQNEISISPFQQQWDYYQCKSQVKGAFAGKRAGKTEIGAFDFLMTQEEKPNYIPSKIDPYLGVIIAPTHDMLKRISWKKFKAYAKPLIKHDIKSPLEIDWHDGSEVIGISADKPERIEGIKANQIWIDEVFQVKEQVFLECLARVADSNGFLKCTGSLGIQYVNPRQHWAHKYFKEMPDKDTKCFEWSTLDNPYFPKEQLEKLKNRLDEQTFKQMFEINWDITSSSAVYSNFSDDNIIDEYKFNPDFQTFMAIDWGWAHPMAVGFFQYDARNDIVYLYDEIISSRITLDALYQEIKNKGYNLDAVHRTVRPKGRLIDKYCCDVAGNQEREQTGISNVCWFRNKGINFKFRATAINYGIPIVRSYIKSGTGQVKFKVVKSCKKSIAGMRGYRYPEKDGIIQNENPVKVDDDACDMIRYMFVNFLDERIMNRRTKTIQL